MKSNNNILSFLTINDLKKHKIYLIKNLINNKEYVGQTIKTIEERFNKHCKAHSVVGRAIRKHGRENFTIEILVENLSQEEAGELEKFYIKELNTLAKNGKGYNVHEGGFGGNTREGMSEEEKDSIKRKRQKTWDNKSPEQKAEIKRRELETKANKSEEEKNIIRKKQSEAKNKESTSIRMKKIHNNRTEKERLEINNKIRASIIGSKHKEETKKKISLLTSGSNNPRYINIILEEKNFIIEKRKDGLSYNKITKVFNEKFNKNIGTAVICRVINYPSL